ncbi:hypothetical protein HanRHA438_Chr01g0013091 [Helianthus annuus]|nr:hypothetical protein HanIR_Chr01g0014161 [Helianthus annuus]KAJ0947249.1 hypothetical protein HanRHA438_Chr01g0013091 [Helianthus annuus]
MLNLTVTVTVVCYPILVVAVVTTEQGTAEGTVVVETTVVMAEQGTVKGTVVVLVVETAEMVVIKAFNYYHETNFF